MIVFFTYDRPGMVQQSIYEVADFDHKLLILDDHSDYDPKKLEGEFDYRRSDYNGGKEGYWEQWQWAFDIIKHDYPAEDHIIFMPDDWHSHDVKTLNWINDQFDSPYAFNVVNRGHSQSWTPYYEHEDEISGWKCLRNYFVDCGFSTNRTTLERLHFTMAPVPKERFRHRPRISSGVGRQLSFRLYKMGIPMYKPITSLAWHDGTHESKMHPLERSIHPNTPI